MGVGESQHLAFAGRALLTAPEWPGDVSDQGSRLPLRLLTTQVHSGRRGTDRWVVVEGLPRVVDLSVFRRTNQETSPVGRTDMPGILRSLVPGGSPPWGSESVPSRTLPVRG